MEPNVTTVTLTVALKAETNMEQWQHKDHVSQKCPFLIDFLRLSNEVHNRAKSNPFSLSWQSSTLISLLLNRFQQTGNVGDRPRSGRPRKSEYHFLTTSSRSNRFLPSRILGCLLKNATGTWVCDKTVRNRLNAAWLKVRRPYVGISLTLWHH